MAGEDFIHVQLSPAGEKRAGGAPIRIAVGRRVFVFKAGEAQRIDKSYEWGTLLSNEHYQGEPMFMVAPPKVEAPVQQPAPVKSEEPEALVSEPTTGNS